METFDDEMIFKKFRFHRATIYFLTALIEHRLRPKVEKRGITLQPCLQVCVALRFYAIGTYQNAIGDMIGIDQSTVCRVIDRVTNALFELWPQFISMPSQREANLQKVKFFQMQRFPSVFGCVDGTHVKIQAPVMQEHEYVNRKQFHSINCQVGVQITQTSYYHTYRILRFSMRERLRERERKRERERMNLYFPTLKSIYSLKDQFSSLPSQGYYVHTIIRN